MEQAPDRTAPPSAFGPREGSADVPEPLFDLDRLAFAVRLRARTIACGAALGLLGGIAFAQLTTPVPTARTQLQIRQAAAEAASERGRSTAAALCNSNDVAMRAAAALGVAAADLTAAFRCRESGANLVMVQVGAPTEDEALRRAGALGVAVAENRRASAQTTAAELGAVFLARRAAQTLELAGVVGQLGGSPTSPDPALLKSRDRLVGQIDAFTKSDQDAATQALADSARVIDPPQIVPAAPLRRTGLGGVVGLVLGAGLALGLALLGAVVRDRPVRRRDVARALGAPVIMELRRPSRLRLRRGRSADLAPAAAALARLVAPAPHPVALLHLGCAKVAGELAERMADLPTGAAAGPRVGALAPRVDWPALQEYGPLAVLIVRAGHSTQERLRALARDLDRAQTEILGVLLVDAHPADHTDGVANAEFYAAMERHREWLHTSGATR